jgi:hypothetical protein
VKRYPVLKIWKKHKLNSEKIWKIQKKSKMNSEKLGKLRFCRFSCFGWNLNAIAAAAAAAAAHIPLSAAVVVVVVVVVVVDIRSILLYFPYLFTIQLTFLP